MSEIFLPYKPRREDPFGHMVVQANLDELLKFLNAFRRTVYVGMCLPHPGPIVGYDGAHATTADDNLVFADANQLWAVCNGYDGLLKTEWPEVYAFLGSNYDVDATHFRLPRFIHGRMPKTPFANHTDQNVVAEQGGNDKPTITAAMLPTTSPWGATFSGTAGNTGTESAGHTHSGTTGGENETQVHNPGGSNLDFWGGVSEGGVLIAAGGDFRINSTGQTGGAAGGHTHNFTTGGVSANHTHGFTPAGTISMTSNSGGGQPTDVREYYEVIGAWVILMRDPLA